MSPQRIGATLILAALLWLVAPTLGPIFVLVALYALVLPARGERWVGAILTGATLLVILWALGRLTVVLAPFVVALILAYVLDPVVDRMERGRLGRSGAVALLLLFVLAAFGLILVVLVPAAIEATQAFVEGASTLGSRLSTAIRPWLDRLPTDRAGALAEEYLPQMTGWLERIGRVILDGLSSLGQGIGALAELVSFLVVTPILLFYLLVDIDRIRAGSLGLVPARHRTGVAAFLEELDGTIGAYFRGQVIVSSITGLLTGGLLLAVGTPYAIGLGLATAILNLVPIVGFYVGLVLALVVAATSGQVWPLLLWVALIYVGVQQIEGHLLSPRIIGREVGLHPVGILMGIVVFGSLFGLVGVLLAVPLATITRMLAVRAIARYRASTFYERAG